MKLRTILVPLDGSALSERALPYAEHLARAGGGKILLLRVGSARPEGEASGVEQEVWEQLDAVAAGVRAAGVETEVVVRQSYLRETAEVICRTARRQKAGLIVMSTHGRGGPGRWLYGSVADAVLREAEVPVLLVPAASVRPWKEERRLKILVPLDGSDLANEGLDAAAEMADYLEAEMVLLGVVQVPTYAYAEGYAYAALDPNEDREAVQRDLEAAAERLRVVGHAVTTRVEIGFPPRVISDVARKEDVDMITMATHGRGGLARLVLGSVATGTLQRADLPILLVRPTRLPGAGEEPRAEPAPAPTPPPAVAPAPIPAPTGPTVELRVTAAELYLLERGLDQLTFAPEANWRLAEAARSLAARLREQRQKLRDEIGEPVGVS